LLLKRTGCEGKKAGDGGREREREEG